MQASADGEIAGVVDRGLGAQGTILLEVLLDARGLVVDVQRRRDAVGDDARPSLIGKRAMIGERVQVVRLVQLAQVRGVRFHIHLKNSLLT